MTPNKVRSANKLLKDGLPPREVAENLGVLIQTLYRWCPATKKIDPTPIIFRVPGERII